MIKKTLQRLKRAPVPAVALLLFAAVISIIICALYESNEAELRKQEEAYRIIPVNVTVEGVTREDGITGEISPWTIDLFTGKNPVEIMDKSSENREITQISLSDYLKDVRIKMSNGISFINDLPALDQTTHVNPLLIGITSLPSDERLLPENGCEITWYEGYDESVFGGEELVCLVPEGKVENYDNGNGAAELYFLHKKGRMDGDTLVEISRHEYECTLKIVGTYTAGDLINIYCPFSIMEQVCLGLETRPTPDSISATIADNLLLDEFREKASFFYSNLSENVQNSSDGIMVLNRSKTWTFDNFSNALDIDDSELLDFMSDLEDSNIKFNRTVKVFIVILSATMGFIAGYLMLHCRKCDNALMHVNWKSNTKAYFGVVLEQIICIALGIFLGGACYLWKPIDKLLLFAIAYFVAFVIVALLFLVIQLVKKTRKYYIS